MKALGHAPQVEPAEDATALFYVSQEGRAPIRWRNGRFVIGDTSHTASSLQAEAADHPDRFSPNVLLRPLIEDRLFPSVCYVAGPSELAYHAQLGAAIASRGRVVKDAIVTLDSTLAGAVDTTLDRMRDTLQSLHGKIVQAAKRNDETLRVLAGVFFQNRYGPDFVNKLLDVLPLDTDQHYVVTL